MLMRMLQHEPESRGAGQGAASSPASELWLLGQPPLRDYLDFVHREVAGAASLDRGELAAEWRRANEHYARLEREEAGLANGPERRPLDASFEPLAAEVRAQASFRRGFDALPTRFEMVELDRLMVFQKHVSATFVHALAARLGSAPEPRTLFTFCMPLGERDCPVQMRREGPGRYVLRCESTDFRYLESRLLRPDELRAPDVAGPVAGVVALMVGFGPNFLNAIALGKRLMLSNGYHRACALRAAGVTHAPCIVQTAGTVDDLELVAKSEVLKDPRFYFESARPPLLKDFFDPAIRKLLPVRPRMRVIEVDYQIRDFMVDA